MDNGGHHDTARLEKTWKVIKEALKAVKGAPPVSLHGVVMWSDVECYCDVLCCDVLCCAVLCCAVLCCAVLCCAVLWCVSGAACMLCWTCNSMHTYENHAQVKVRLVYDAMHNNGVALGPWMHVTTLPPCYCGPPHAHFLACLNSSGCC